MYDRKKYKPHSLHGNEEKLTFTLNREVVLMKKIISGSIRKRLFVSMLAFSMLVVCFITGIAVRSTYHTMREQLIYNRRMSIGWLQDRMELEADNYQDLFYGFEVDRSIRETIESWCLKGEEPDYSDQWKLITMMNEVISMDSNLNSIELYNLLGDEVLVAERSGASIQKIQNRMDHWFEREEGLQSNLVFMRSEKDIQIAHRIHRFSDKLPYALVVLHVRPFQIQDMLEEIKMTPDETVLVLNDENQLIEADYGVLSGTDSQVIRKMAQELSRSDSKECLYEGNFWFYREVRGGKLKVMLSVPDEVIKEALRGTYMAALLAGIVMLAVCAVWSVFFSNLFSKPIVALAGKMRSFTLDENTASEEKHGKKEEDRKDEIGILQKSFYIMVDRNQKLIAQEYQLKLEKREAQMRALQAQINPHFMYNILQVIGGMALGKNAPEIYRVTNALGDLMRYCLNFSRETVALREEIHYLQSYCMLQNERFSGRIRLELDLEEELLAAQIPKLILQPVLENSFHHGLAGKSGDWILQVKGQHKEEELLLTISDNGVGIKKEQLSELQKKLENSKTLAIKAGAHIGLQNVNARIRLQDGSDNYGVTIISKEGEGTTVYIRMKYRTAEPGSKAEREGNQDETIEGSHNR